MNGLKTFYEELSSADKDIFLQIISEFSVTVSQSVKDELEERLKEVTKQIDKINNKRENLGSKADLFSKFAQELVSFSKRKNTSLELILLKQFFNEEEDKLRKQIAELRPDKLLKEKYDIKNDLREMRDKTDSFAKINIIMHHILKKGNKRKSAIKSKEFDDKKK